MATERAIRRLAALFLALALAVTLVAPPASARERERRAPSPREIERDLRFATEMASKGLWREALYRWRKVLRHRPDDPRLLNNIAVALEATGEFEKARKLYERALAQSGADDQIAGNLSLLASTQERIERRDEAPATSAGESDAGRE